MSMWLGDVTAEGGGGEAHACVRNVELGEHHTLFWPAPAPQHLHVLDGHVAGCDEVGPPHATQKGEQFRLQGTHLTHSEGWGLGAAGCQVIHLIHSEGWRLGAAGCQVIHLTHSEG